jgi:hypothetical protein
MSYKDVDYSFITDDTARPTTSLILPSKNGFKPLSTEVQKVVHLRQVVKLPTAPQSRAGIPSASTTILPQPSVQVRTKREQPKGLRMRYRPSGAGTGDIGSIGSPDSDEPTSSRPVITSSNAAVSKKRKERDENTVSGEKKKKKKDKHREGHAIENTTATAAKEGSKKSKDLPSGFSTINVAAKLNGHAESKKKDKEKKKKERDREKA